MTFSAFFRLLRLDKPVGNFLLLWPTLGAVFVAGSGKPAFKMLLIFTLGVFIMRAAGSVINDIFDQDFDGKVKRTCKRPLATGEMTTSVAVKIFISLLVFALILALFLNWQTILLAFVGVLMAIVYPLMKRITYFPQLFLGFVWSWGILMAFTAQGQTLGLSAWILYASNVFLTLGYDTLYGMVDREDDLQIGVKSTAIYFENRERLFVGFCQATTLILLLFLGKLSEFTWPYYCGLSLALVILIYQQIRIREESREQYFSAFLSHQWVGLCILIGIVANYFS